MIVVLDLRMIIIRGIHMALANFQSSGCLGHVCVCGHGHADIELFVVVII